MKNLKEKKVLNLINNLKIRNHLKRKANSQNADEILEINFPHSRRGFAHLIDQL